MDTYTPDQHTAVDAFAVAMLVVMLLSMGLVALLFYTIRQSHLKRNHEVDELLDELRDEAQKPTKPQPPKEPQNAWEKDPDFWKKSD